MTRTVYASINIYSDSVPPDEITRMLSVDCDRAVFKGKEIRSGVVAEQHAWIYTSKDRVTSEELNDHLEYLLNIIDDNSFQLQSIDEKDSWMRIFCFWESPNGNGGPIIPSKMIKRLAEFPFDLEFDVWL